jgi:hypothetical protein
MKPWSFSTLEKFETCPHQFHEIKVLGNVVEQESEHQLWGKEVHTAFEDCIDSRGKVPLPAKMKHWQPLANKVLAMKNAHISTEVPVALDKNFQAVDWDSEECWTRGVIDVLVIGKTSAVIIDWKTGKRKPTEQLKLYAAYVFAMYPHIEVVHTALVWLQSKRIDKDSVERRELSFIWQGFIERAARLRSAYERDSWPEAPNGLCKNWCPVTSCKYNGRREPPI